VAVPRLPAVRVRSSSYGFAVLNDRGRIAARGCGGCSTGGADVRRVPSDYREDPDLERSDE
jgi:hypothetical protein